MFTYPKVFITALFIIIKTGREKEMSKSMEKVK